MSAGTITLTNGSAIVGGSGTSFATELAAGDFIVSTVGGVPYTLPVKSVESNAQLTLVSNFTGPTQSDTAWSAVPRVALNMVTAALVAQSAEALRGLNYDKQNWQSIFSGNGNITITLPDGTTWTGPAWNSITTSLSGKAAKGANNDITSLSGLTTALSLEQGGTGSTTSADALNKLGALPVAGASGLKARYRFNASGGSVGIIFDDTGLSGYGSLFNDWDKKALAFNCNFNGNGQFAVHTIHRYVYPGVSAGCFYSGLTSDISYQIGHLSSSGNLTASFSFNYEGSAFANNGTWTSASDVRIKRDVNRIENPFEKMRKIRGVTWYRKDSGEFGIGMIAQEIQAVFPEAIKTNGFSLTMPDGEVVEDVLFPDTVGVSAALHHEAILVLMDKIEILTKKIEALQSGS
ncbi:tail fiber domain-containing protein [Enterobacter roggenkampii]|uniref:tail fiber domain-containing protein n=1 Tax=Enterobacter roggenkampii TaxID=1812935 RepID=UPI002004F5EB|nr:tail fiber domain-containing protein [Enterobacter roggenkampii]MCK7202389.1 tail fiber domain-containing protein [Enterobacter roggenkampii]